MDALARGEDLRHLAPADRRSVLVVEPLRWALALEPAWLAWEQVPAVLPLWRLAADVLEARGWRCWTGVLTAADYGTPQVRRRAVLIGSRAGTPGRPAPSHAEGGADGLAPWVSMVEALGWDPAWKLRAHYRRANPARSHRGKALRVYPKEDVIPTTRPSRTVVGGAVMWRLRTPRGNRRLEVPEVSRLQGFPDWYPWPDSRRLAFAQIANAVPPQLARAVLAEAMRAANGDGPPEGGPSGVLLGSGAAG
jgi:DNA (cytosine-5)-methyltransferase 1